MGKRKRKKGTQIEEDSVPIESKWRDSTVVVSLPGHVKDPEVLKMCRTACENWDRISCFTNDLALLYMNLLISNDKELPDLEDKKEWEGLINKARQIHRANSPDIVGKKRDEIGMKYWAQPLNELDALL